MIGLDWRGLMQSGLHGLRLTPAQFWGLTPLELQVMLGLSQISAPMARSRLAELEARFPDALKENENG